MCCVRASCGGTAHGMEQEHVTGGVGQENVALGTLLHQESYPDKARKDILIDGLLRWTSPTTARSTRSRRARAAKRPRSTRLLYYLYYLKHVKGIETTGMIDYPQQKRREAVTLTPEYEADIERILGADRRPCANRPRRPPSPSR